MQQSSNKKRLIDNTDTVTGVHKKHFTGRYPTIVSNLNLNPNLNPNLNNNINLNLNFTLYNNMKKLNLPPFNNISGIVNANTNNNHINNDNINNNIIIKNKRGDNEKSKAPLIWIQQKAAQIKQMFTDVKISHRQAISLAGEEYRNENGTIRAKKISKTKIHKKTKKTKNDKHICSNCNYTF